MGESSSFVSVSMIATGCTQRVGVLDWSRRLNVIAFASNRNICLARIGDVENHSRILSSIVAHEKPIVCLAFPDIDGELLPSDLDFVISASTDGSFAVWSVRQSTNGNLTVTPFVPTVMAHKNHTANVCCLAMKTRQMLTFSAATDSTFLLQWWNLGDETDTKISDHCSMLTEKRYKMTGNCYAICAKFFNLKHYEMPILIIGDTNSRLDLYCEEYGKHEFIKLLTLSGHSDWIRSLSFKETNNVMLLASGSQDNYIRLWRFIRSANGEDQPRNGELRTKSLKAKLPSVSPADDLQQLTVRSEAILSGHEAWVHSVNWHPSESQLLSASLDKCVIIWSERDGVWTETVRLGNIGGQAVGFYGAIFSPDGDFIVANSYFGAFYIWQRVEDKVDQRWRSEAAFGGHFKPVTDVVWDPTGSYLLSCSLDQTTRAYAPIAEKNGYAEIGRPQVHGHDLLCITSLSSYVFVSGAEEKIFRAFRASHSFADRLTTISGIRKDKVFPEEKFLTSGSATVPSLGLSNKVMPEDEEEEEQEPFDVGGNELPDSTVMPVEDELMERTLWPEEQKLYGHGSEVFAVAGNHAGTLLATSCKASHPKEAEILLWDTMKWERVSSLQGHQLTVTQLAFSPDDRYLLSVSRDRCWSLFHCTEGHWGIAMHSSQLGKQFEHSRIIWGCAWSSDGDNFATVSRDKKVRIWNVVNDETTAIVRVIPKAAMSRSSAITAVDICPGILLRSSNYLLIVGLENGIIELLRYQLGDAGGEISLITALDQNMAHAATVTRIRFRPVNGSWRSADEVGNCWQFASAGDDHQVKVYAIDLTGL